MTSRKETELQNQIYELQDEIDALRRHEPDSSDVSLQRIADTLEKLVELYEIKVA